MLHDVAVIGGGPAGIAASIYLKRSGNDIILFEKDEIGGLLLNAHQVENYPGFPNGITGKKLCELLDDHIKRWKIKTFKKEIKKIKRENHHFVISNQKNEWIFNVVIIATGTIPRSLGISGEQNLSQKYVFYEIKDLLPKLKSKNCVTVIGGGDAAFDYSLNLADNDVFVELYYRSTEPKCLKLLKERVNKSSKIKSHPNFEPIKITENSGIPETRFKSLVSKKESNIKSDYVLIACGRKPNQALFTEDFEKNKIPGFYIAGDVKTGQFRQIGIAVGDGIHTAMEVEGYLRGKIDD